MYPVNSDQLAHPCSLTGVFTVHLKKLWVLTVIHRVPSQDLSEYVCVQADPQSLQAARDFEGFVVLRHILSFLHIA